MRSARKEAKDKADQPDRAVELRMSAVDSIAEVSKADWDACANPHRNPNRLLEAESDTSAVPCLPGQDLSLEISYNPFVSHDFLSALEESKSVGGRTGWHVQHVLAKTSDGTLVAAAPAYLKSHSRGEYVFDAGWAEAYARAGGSYYPKLQISVPFTPATGPRLLVRDGLPAPAVRRALAQGLTRFCGVAGASGVHVTFATEAEYRLLGELGYLQ
ncbi:MAG: peptidogalycan biosysnthesis protein, partial [Xanthobacteraceae bacterium]